MVYECIQLFGAENTSNAPTRFVIQKNLTSHILFQDSTEFKFCKTFRRHLCQLTLCYLIGLYEPLCSCASFYAVFHQAYLCLISAAAHLDRVMYVLGYIPKENRLYLGDKELNVVSFSLLLSVLEYQTAVMRKDFDTADKVGYRLQ